MAPTVTRLLTKYYVIDNEFCLKVTLSEDGACGVMAIEVKN